VRRIGVLIRNLPADAASMIAVGRSGWRLEHYLLADLFQAGTGQPHPGLPAVEAQRDPVREERLRRGRIRLRERERAIAAGDIN
jgi:hypothetical protein